MLEKKKYVYLISDMEYGSKIYIWSLQPTNKVFKNIKNNEHFVHSDASKFYMSS